MKAFKNDYGTKFPKAVEKITSEVDVLLEFYNYPAEHWIHLRTTNPIESRFSTVRLRTKVTKGPGSRMAGLAMAFQAHLKQPRAAGVRSTRRTLLRWSEPALRSAKASWSNGRPTRTLRSWSRKGLHPQVLTIPLLVAPLRESRTVWFSSS